MTIRSMTHASLVLAILACGSVAARARAADVPPRAAQGVRYVYLIRHGMYDRDDKADDRTGNGLNALGHTQSRLLGARLAALPVKFDILVSSDFARARETADDVGRALGMTPARDSLLRECSAASDRPGGMRAGDTADAAACDSTLQLAWARYMRPSPDADARDVLVCHGNMIRWLVCRALGVDTKRWTGMDIANASVTVIEVRADGSTRLAEYSDVGHLPVDTQTWTGRGAGWAKASVR